MRPRQMISSEMLADRNYCLVQVSKLTGVPVDDIMSGSQKAGIAEARRLTAWILHGLRGYTANQCAIMLRLHHTTITTHTKNLNITNQKELINKMEALKKMLNYEKEKV